MRVTPVAGEALFNNGEWRVPVRLQMQRLAWTSSPGGLEPHTEHSQYTDSADKGEHQSNSWAFLSPTWAL